jgi:abhydrolase domain-containing protein 17
MGGVVEKAAFHPPQHIRSRDKRPDRLWLVNDYGHHFPSVVAYARQSSRYLIYAHGNAEDIDQLEPWIQELSDVLGVNIIAWEYSGYGDSRLSEDDSMTPIVPKEAYCYANALAVYDYLIQQGVSANNIMVFGRSLGTGSAVELATRRQVRGLILQSPMMSAIRVVQRTGITLPMDIFANIDKMRHIRAQTLVIHGTDDRVIPIRHGQKIFSAIPQRLGTACFIEGAGHNNIESEFALLYTSCLKEWIDNLWY